MLEGSACDLLQNDLATMARDAAKRNREVKSWDNVNGCEDLLEDLAAEIERLRFDIEILTEALRNNKANAERLLAENTELRRQNPNGPRQLNQRSNCRPDERDMI